MKKHVINLFMHKWKIYCKSTCSFFKSSNKSNKLFMKAISEFFLLWLSMCVFSVLYKFFHVFLLNCNC